MVAPAYERALSSLQSCLTLCEPVDSSPPGSSVHGILRQEYGTGWPCPPPGDLPNPGIELISPALAGEFFTTETPGEPLLSVSQYQSERGRQRLTPHGADQAAGVCSPS